MNGIGAYIMPLIVVLIILYGQIKGVNVFDSFIEGAGEGLSSFAKLLPALVALVTAVSMLRGSGALDIIVWFLSPAAKLLGIPQEVMPLAILSPISGSGSISMFESLLEQHGPDSYIGKVASVMAGSSETTFYAVTVYYGCIGIRKTRHTVMSALMGDFVIFILSAWIVRVLG